MQKRTNKHIQEDYGYDTTQRYLTWKEGRKEKDERGEKMKKNYGKTLVRCNT